jgi:hypothetical protein
MGHSAPTVLCYVEVFANIKANSKVTALIQDANPIGEYMTRSNALKTRSDHLPNMSILKNEDIAIVYFFTLVSWMIVSNTKKSEAGCLTRYGDT